MRLLLAGVLTLLLASACSGSGPSDTAGETLPVLAVPSGPRVTAEPSEPADTGVPADTPSPDDAYQQLLAAIPLPIAAACVRVGEASHRREPGEFASATCTSSAGGVATRVTYRLFDGSASMDAFFDAQVGLITAAGRARTPPCGQGAHHDTWDNGRVECFRSANGNAQIQWTHDLLYVYAAASRDDADLARLLQFWAAAGPVAP